VLLVIDVGNTNIVLGAMVAGEVVEQWRISTARRTTDEMGLVLLELLRLRGIATDRIQGVIISCVVPSLLFNLTKACRRYLDIEAMVVGSGVKTGMRVRTDNPREVGADRVVNAVAATERWGTPVVVVDFGTATTFDCVDRRGDYVGGAIAPGLAISAEALFQRTSKLPKVEVSRPRRAIGTNTIASMQSGLFHGYVGLVDHLAAVCKAELRGPGDDPVFCVATGGFSNLIGRACSEIDEVDDALTLRGLWQLWERNKA